jgi:transposase-like protein
VINVDKNPAYPAAVDALKTEGVLPRRVRLRQCKYLNNVIEQDHRTVKKRTWLAKGDVVAEVRFRFIAMLLPSLHNSSPPFTTQLQLQVRPSKLRNKNLETRISRA